MISMGSIVILFVAYMVILAVSVITSLVKSSENRRLQKENRRLKQLLQKEFLMENDYMDSFVTMFQEAGHNGNARKDGGK